MRHHKDKRLNNFLKVTYSRSRLAVILRFLYNESTILLLQKGGVKGQYLSRVG